jgi:hypothetical protein
MEGHPSHTRRFLKRLLRIALCLVVAVVALSIGLRVYSAWQIPRARRLMNAMSQLRALRPFDNHIHNLIAEYGFCAADPDHCTTVSCNYQVLMGAPYPNPVSLNQFEHWCIDRILVPLGFHPWGVWASLSTERGRLSSIQYSFSVLDPTGFGTGGHIDEVASLDHPYEDSPNIVVGGASNYPFSFLYLSVHIAPEAGDISSQLKPNFACIWGLRLCTNKFDVFPGLRDHHSQVEARRNVRLASDNQCPATNSFMRIRDNDLVWIGSVLKAVGSDFIALRQEKVLKNESGGEIPAMVSPAESSMLLFKDGFYKNRQVIVFANSSDCNVVPASPENLAEVAKSLAAHPPLDRSRPLGVAPMPTWHIPPDLR